jgi:putative Mg2+ transporter-C (MgtC) family protein
MAGVEHAKAAGLRTTILVCMAASVAMLQMNYLLPLTGHASDSFVTNDLMRLPLGILTGVGFIGGGAILRRGSLIVGVTTAATLWYGCSSAGWRQRLEPSSFGACAGSRALC